MSTVKKRIRGRCKKRQYLQEGGFRAEMLMSLRRRFQYVKEHSQLVQWQTSGFTRRPRSDPDAEDKNIITKALCAAVQNRLVVDVDIVALARDGRNVSFPNPQFGYITEPCMIVDRQGCILVWYFPRVLPKRHQDNLLSMTKHLDGVFANSISPAHWRTHPCYFQNTAEPGIVKGTGTFSPGWFALGHGKCPTADIKASCSIRNNMNQGINKWLEGIKPSYVFLDRLLFMTHPSLHDAAASVLAKLQDNHLTKTYADIWPTIFSGITPITNRVSRPHKDKFGDVAWYDQVVTLGNYSSSTLEFPELGATFQYDPGTVVQFCGNLLTHSVSKWEGGYRVCYASFFRKDVFERLEVDLPGWSTELSMKDWIIASK